VRRSIRQGANTLHLNHSSRFIREILDPHCTVLCSETHDLKHGAIKNPVEHRKDVSTGPEQRRGRFSQLGDKKNQAIAFHNLW
jgi:hypothetical protein